ncbi:unnamed protein product [Polarella glacialis]|uniref:Uncharacterized protein n=1 Tax=Polarella glacialis TaxID=89957 RepID=A0A813EWA0_POLGL|nr:unnamed protein product [Polarella glacialis]
MATATARRLLSVAGSAGTSPSSTFLTARRRVAGQVSLSVPPGPGEHTASSSSRSKRSSHLRAGDLSALFIVPVVSCAALLEAWLRTELADADASAQCGCGSSRALFGPEEVQRFEEQGFLV